MYDLKNQRLLVIAPHPDDEVIGCAGLITKIKRLGGKVFVLFLTNGDTQDFTQKGMSKADERVDEIKKVAKFLKFDEYDIALPGNEYHLRLDLIGQKALMEIIERGSKVSIENIKPTLITFPSLYSYNQDHRAAAYAAHAAVRPSERHAKHFISTVLGYEEITDQWSLEKTRDSQLFIELTQDDLNSKLKAMQLYISQDRKAPNPRSREILKTNAIIKGSLVGIDFAESYIVYRDTA